MPGFFEGPGINKIKYIYLVKKLHEQHVPATKPGRPWSLLQHNNLPEMVYGSGPCLWQPIGAWKCRCARYQKGDPVQ